MNSIQNKQQYKIFQSSRLSGGGRWCVVLLCCYAFFSTATVRADETFRFGTGGTAGSYFPIGSLIAVAINRKRIQTYSGDLVVLPQRSSGSVSNLADIAAGLLEGGLAQADVVSLAYGGNGQFKDIAVDTKLRTVGTLYLESMHLVVIAESNINGVADLAGKRVSVDELGSGTQLDVDPVLAAYGMTRDDIKPIYLKPVDSIDRMRRGLLDAFFVIAGYPVAGVKQLVEDGVGRVVNLEGDRITKLTEDYVYFTSHAIPENIYSNDTEIPTLSVPAQMIVHADISDDVVYEITKTLWSDSTLSALAAGHPRGADINAATALEGVSIPLHPGAVRFYKEQGYDNRSLVQ